MSILAVPASTAPGFVLLLCLGTMTKGARGLGEQKGMAAVPLGAHGGGTVEGGQESPIYTPRWVWQLPSRRGQTLPGHGHGYPPLHGMWQPSCCHRSPYTHVPNLGLELAPRAAGSTAVPLLCAGCLGTCQVWWQGRASCRQHLSPLPALRSVLPGDPRAPLSVSLSAR